MSYELKFVSNLKGLNYLEIKKGSKTIEMCLSDGQADLLRELI